MKISKQGIHLNLYILTRIIISYFVFILLIFMLNKENDNRLSSFLIVNFSALVSISILSFGLKSKLGFNIIKFLLIAYFVKLIIGYLFWQFYIFPDYFSDPMSNFKFSHQEYLATEDFMRDLAENRMIFGFFYVPPRLIIMIKHLPIHFLMSNMYLSGSYNPLDLSIQNNLFSTYTGVIVMAITNLFGATTKQLKLSLNLALYQPFTSISTIIWRDTVGHFFVALGGYLTIIALKKNYLLAIFIILLASLSMLIQRQLYFFYPAITYMIYSILKSKRFYYFAFIPIIFLALNFVNNYFKVYDSLFTGYGSNLSSPALWYFLPFNIFRLFLGPFPWTQWFNFNDLTIFQIGDYLQSVLTIVLIIFCFRSKNQEKTFTNNENSFISLYVLFILFIFAALGTTDIHQVYMTAGVIFLIPPSIRTYNNRAFIILSSLLIFVFIILNILFIVAGFSGSGIGSSLR